MSIKTQREYYNYSGAEPVKAEILEIRPGQDRDETFAIKAECAVLLDKTIFYPEGGGQPGDRGSINGYPLIDVREEDGEILHIVSMNKRTPNNPNGPDDLNGSLKPGEAELVLDWKRRRDFTVIHTGQHLLSGILFHKFNIPTASVHLGDENCFIDVKCSEIKEEKVFEAEEMVMDAIEENRRVITHLCPPEDPQLFPLRKPPPKDEELIRILEIEGIDFSPCCGTHLKSTGEIMMLRVIGAEKYKGMTRLGFIAGRRVLYDSRQLRKNAEIASRALSVPIGETGRGVLDFMEKTNKLEFEFKIMKEESTRQKAEALVKKTGVYKEVSGQQKIVIIEIYKTDMSDVLSIGKKAQKLSDAVFFLISEPDNKFAAFCSQKEIDIRPLFLTNLKEYNGKGGGGPSFFQGSFNSAEDLAAFAGEFCFE